MTQVYGIDFTSRPGPRKPLTCAVGKLRDHRLTVETVECWTDFGAFEEFLRRPGPWIAAIDAPFGLPRAFVEDMKWPSRWNDCIARISALGRANWVGLARRYADSQPAGRKYPRRTFEPKVGAASPLNVVNPPVGKMLFECVPRLLDAELSILPCRPRPNSSRVVVEAYGRPVAAEAIGRVAYKGPRASIRRRREILAALHVGLPSYGIAVAMPGRDLARDIVSDRDGDRLDAVLACLQAAWAHRNPDFAAGRDPLEGWIADPALLKD